MRIGYVRPLEEDLDGRDQYGQLANLECHAIYMESHSSPKHRLELEKMLEGLEAGDKVIVSKLHVLADSTRQLAELMDLFEQKNILFYSVEEKIDTSLGKSFSFPEIVKCLAEFQSDAISAKTKAGLSEAKQKGVYAGRPRKPDANVKKAIEMHKSKLYSLADIKEQTGISKSTLYRYLEN